MHTDSLYLYIKCPNIMHHVFHLSNNIQNHIICTLFHIYIDSHQKVNRQPVPQLSVATDTQLHAV